MKMEIAEEDMVEDSEAEEEATVKEDVVEVTEKEVVELEVLAGLEEEVRTTRRIKRVKSTEYD